MSDELVVGTPVAGENTHPVTDAVSNQSAESSDNVATPIVEQRDGKMYVDGVRVYSRDDTNRIAAKARSEVERSLLGELGVDSFDQVKSVVSSLQSGENTSGDLNIDSLRDAVKKREQTVEELRSELSKVKTEMVLKEHITKLNDAMPSQWNAEQKRAVVDLMKSRDMLVLQEDAFAIRFGDSYLTDESGEAPDYSQAVSIMGKTLGLPMSKTGVATFDSDNRPSANSTNRGIDNDKLKSDPQYRNAYVQVRERNKNLSRSQITDAMVKKQMDGQSYASGSQRMLTGSPSTPKSSRRK